MEDTHSTAGTSPKDLQEILARLMDQVEGGASPPSPASHTEGERMPPPADEGAAFPLAGLLSNPALLSALPILMENLSPLMGNLSRGVGRAPTVTRPHAVDRHTALLCALKPYLSPRRQEVAETVIRLCRVWDALEKSGIHVGDLLGGMSRGAGEPLREGRGGDV